MPGSAKMFLAIGSIAACGFIAAAVIGTN